MAENPDGSWSYTYSLLPGTLEINCAFNNGGGLWDNNAGTDWNVTVMNCTNAPPPPQTACLVSGSPAVSGNAPGQNFSTDAFDLDTSGGPVATSVLSGFGTFGNVYLNYDESNLYIGAEATDVEADNNAAILFVGVDTLTHDATHLRDKSGNPRALDVLDNLDLITPMDIAILIGDEYGDGTFPVFNLGSGGSFGQGIFALAAGTFPEVAGAALSQFDGAGSTPTGNTDADGNRITDRWEARIPWSSLAATGVTGLASVHLAGIIASTGENGGNRYLSGNVLGAAMTPSGMDGGNVGFNDMDLTGFEVCLPVPDTDGDGLPDLWETQYYGGPTAAVAGSDDDGDGFTALQEFWLGTHPTNAASSLKITTVSRNGSATWLTFKTIGDKAYDIEFSDDLTGPGGGFLLATQVTEMDVAAGNEAQESFVDDFLATGGPPTNDIRHYRINFPVP